MDDDFKVYFNNIINHIEDLGGLSITLESRINSTTEQTKNYEQFFSEEISEIKALLHDLNLFIDGLTKQFEKLQEKSSDFVSSEEMEELSLNVARINFENLQMRKTFKEKL